MSKFASDPSLGQITALGLTGNTVLAVGDSFVSTISITVAGAQGTINDAATVGAANAGNVIAVLPASIGIIPLRWPCQQGIVVLPGAGQTVAVSYSK